MTNKEKYYSTSRQLAEALVCNIDDQYCSHCPIAGERCEKKCREKGLGKHNCIEEIEEWLEEECDD